MKTLLAIALAASVSTVAMADVVVTPLVGYQFQTHNTNNKQVANLGEFQKNHATYGLQVATDVDTKTQVGLEYLRTDSNIDSYQIGVLANREVYGPFYATAGLGYSKLKADGYQVTAPVGPLVPNSVVEGHPGGTQEGAYLNVGFGAKAALTNMINVKAEVRGQYLTNENQWTPVALVGFEFKTDQIAKAYSH